MDKNVKRPEMEAIVRKRQRRKLINSDKRELIFTVRGSMVEPQKIDRWMNRNQVSQDLLYAPRPAACKSTCDGYCLYTTADMLKPPHPTCAVEQFLTEVPWPPVPHTQHKVRTFQRKALCPSPRVLRFLLLPSPYGAYLSLRPVLLLDRARPLSIDLFQTHLRASPLLHAPFKANRVLQQVLCSIGIYKRTKSVCEKNCLGRRPCSGPAILRP